jgi:F-type H+-transporting ATPase subunit b
MRYAGKILLLFLLILVVTSSLSASSDGEEGHDFWGGFIKKALNSIILFGGLFYLLRKPLIKFLSQKSLDVKIEIETGEKTLHEKSKQMTEIDKRLKRIEEEISKLKSEASTRGEAESQRIEKLGQTEAQRVLELSEAEINLRIESAVRDLKAKVADLAIEQFKREILKELDQKMHDSIIDKNINICGDIIEGE